jgi:DNA-binding PadR family transcriptional regulator
MTPVPLCPPTMALLARRPRPAHEVARALGRDYRTAAAALLRLEEPGLVRRRELRAGATYQITRRGASELRLQRLLWTAVVTATG